VTDSFPKDIDLKYFDVIQEVLENDLLVQSGRVDDLKPMTEAVRIATIQYQKAQNRYLRESREKKD
jgi:hypothetical protein